MWPALYGAFALVCNAISGRVTFGLGAMFGLAAVAVIFACRCGGGPALAPPDRPRSCSALLSGLSTMASPVAGLFVGIVAAALLLTRRRPAAYALGRPPTVVVALSALAVPVLR